jgi:hypothetical protein
VSQHRDPEKYRRLSEPFASTDEANENFAQFFEELGTLREKYRMADVYVIVKASAYTPDGMGEFMTNCSYGSSLERLPLTAYAYGAEKQRFEESIAALVKKSGTSR